MKKLTEFKELSINQDAMIRGIHTEEMVLRGCPHNVAQDLADCYISGLVERAKKVNWPVFLVFKTERKFHNFDDLSKPLH